MTTIIPVLWGCPPVQPLSSPLSSLVDGPGFAASPFWTGFLFKENQSGCSDCWAQKQSPEKFWGMQRDQDLSTHYEEPLCPTEQLRFHPVENRWFPRCTRVIIFNNIITIHPWLSSPVQVQVHLYHLRATPTQSRHNPQPQAKGTPTAPWLTGQETST